MPSSIQCHILRRSITYLCQSVRARLLRLYKFVGEPRNDHPFHEGACASPIPKDLLHLVQGHSAAVSFLPESRTLLQRSRHIAQQRILFSCWKPDESDSRRGPLARRVCRIHFQRFNLISFHGRVPGGHHLIKLGKTPRVTSLPFPLRDQRVSLFLSVVMSVSDVRRPGVDR